MIDKRFLSIDSFVIYKKAETLVNINAYARYFEK